MKEQPTNREIAGVLEHIAELLEAQDANPHRVRAYRNSADRVRNLDGSVVEMVRSRDGQTLQDLPDIGPGLARVISERQHVWGEDHTLIPVAVAAGKPGDV